MYHCAKFGADPANGVQNFPSQPQETPKQGYFSTFKNLPKIEKKSDRPSFWYGGNYHVDLSLCQI